MWTQETASKNLERVRNEIRRVYLTVWDPIRVQDEPNAQDEYDSYIDRMISLLVNGASDGQLKKYLDSCAARMGWDGSSHPDTDVIEALRAINLQKD